MAKGFNSRIKIGGDGVEETTLKDTVTNQLIVFADSMEYDSETDMVTLVSGGHTIKCGAQGVSDEFEGKITTSNGCKNFRSRHTKIDNIKFEDGTYEYVNTYVSYSRIYVVVKALCKKQIGFKDLDKLVHNHLDNKGWEEALITDGSALNVKNYELCTYSQNKIHGDAWHDLREWGIEGIFSALNERVVNTIRQLCSAALSQKELIQVLDITFRHQLKSGEFQYKVVEEVSYDGLTEEQIKDIKAIERMF